MTRYLYDNGLPFTSIIDSNIKDTYDRVQANKASLIIIDGQIGQGKTTLGVHIIDRINHYQKKPPTDLKEMNQLGLGGENFLEKLRICYQDKLPAVGYDEAGDFNRRGALTKFNAILNRTFETYRAFKIIPVLMLPAFWVLDNEFFDKGIPRLLLHVSKRNRKQGEISGYSLYRMYYLRKQIKKITVPQQAYGIVRPNFHAHFLNLPPDRAAELDFSSTKGKLNILEKGEIDSQGLIDLKTMAEKIGRQYTAIVQVVKILKIEPRKRIRRKHYFYSSDLERVQDYFLNKTGSNYMR
jgi:hypothetical protein